MHSPTLYQCRLASALVQRGSEPCSNEEDVRVNQGNLRDIVFPASGSFHGTGADIFLDSIMPPATNSPANRDSCPGRRRRSTYIKLTPLCHEAYGPYEKSPPEAPFGLVVQAQYVQYRQECRLLSSRSPVRVGSGVIRNSFPNNFLQGLLSPREMAGGGRIALV